MAVDVPRKAVTVPLPGGTIDDALIPSAITRDSELAAAYALAIQRTNHTGTQSADTLTDGATNKVLTAAEKILLGQTSGTNTGDQTATTVPNTPAGNIAATTVQAAINELDAEKTTPAAALAAADAADLSATAALIEREGLRFDGTAGAVIGNGGIPAVGTGDFTAYFDFRPTANGSQKIFDSLTNGLQIEYGGGGANRISVVKSLVAVVGTFAYDLPLNVSYFIAVVRSSGTTSLYVNGVFAASFADSTNYSATGYYFGSNPSNAELFNGNLSHFGLFNYALTAAEIAALTRRGLVTLPEQKGGSMQQNTSSCYTTFGAAITGASATGFSLTTVGTGYHEVRTAPVFRAIKGQRVRVSFNQVGTQGLTMFLADGVQYQFSAAGSNTLDFTVQTNTAEDFLIFAFSGANGASFAISDLNVKLLGTLFEQDSGQRSAGYMVRDTSGNGRHLELPETSVSINDPADTGFIEYTRATDGFLIGDRRVIPATGYLVEVVATGNGTVTLGESAGTPANVCASVTLTSTPKILSLLVTQTSTGKLYADLGTATTATFKIRHRAV